MRDDDLRELAEIQKSLRSIRSKSDLPNDELSGILRRHMLAMSHILWRTRKDLAKMKDYMSKAANNPNELP